MKTCSQCAQPKPIEAFYPSKVQPCKECHRANRCNQGLGMFRDDPDLLIAASVYLTLHRTPIRRTA